MAPRVASQPISSSVLAAIRSSLAGAPHTAAARIPFITISRGLAADHPGLLSRLMAQLNALNPNPPWLSYDRELIERVASDHGLSEALIRSLENRPHSLLEDFFEGLRSDRPRPPDQTIYAKVVATIRTLARNGRAVIIGRGGVFCTQDMPAGVHVQFVAPMETRIRRMMQQEQVEHDQAHEMIRKADDKQAAFFDRYWPNQHHRRDQFTLTINTATVPLEVQVTTIAQVVLSRQLEMHTTHAAQKVVQ